MAGTSRGQSAWDAEVIELSDIRSGGDQSSLLDSPQSHSSLKVRKIKPNNRIGSPNFSQDSTYESSASLSPVTRNAFFAKPPVPAPRKKLLQPIRSPLTTNSIYSDTSDVSRANAHSIDRLEATQSSASGNETQSVFSGKSTGTRSYREKMRERFMSVKQQAGSSILRAKKRDSVKVPREKDEAEIELENEDRILAVELSRHASKKTLWNASIQEKILARMEAHDFFCRGDFQADVPPEQNDEGDATGEIIDGDSPNELTENPDETKQTILDLLSIDNLLEDFVTEFCKPEIHDLKIYDVNLMYQTGNMISIEDKLGVDFEPRYLEDEGHYVGVKPTISHREINLLEERLFQTGNRNWFGCDGELKYLPDPRRDFLLKPPDFSESTPFETTFQKPILFEDFLQQNIRSIPERILLKLNILKVQFSHHPLFSPEHILAQRLKQNHEDYHQLLTIGTHIRLQKKLLMLRQAKQKLERTFENHSEELTEKQRHRYDKYSNEITKIRGERLDEHRKVRDLLKMILRTWKQLKLVRGRQKFASTSIRLAIKKDMCDYGAEVSEWERLIDVECNEIITEGKIHQQQLLVEYKVQVREWRQHKGDQIEKPIRPEYLIDIHKIKANVTENFMRSFKPPGEPQLLLELHFDHEITKEVDFPRERARRAATRKGNLAAKFRIDGIEVCKTNSVQLNDNFSCSFNEVTPVELNAIPGEITIEIFEYGTPNIKWVYDVIYLDVPGLEIKYADEPKRYATFQMEKEITFSHNGVGNGVNEADIFKPFSLPNYDSEEVLNLCGTLSFRLGWEPDANFEDITLNEPRKVTDIKSLMENHILDPQDPLNVEIIEYLNKVSETSPTADAPFRLNAGDDLLCTEEDIEANPRFKMLRLRAQGEPEFQGVTIPNREMEIPPDAFTEYEQRKAREEDNIFMEDGREDNMIDTQRQWGVRQMHQIRKRMAEMCRIAESTYTLKDILVDDDIPDLGTLGLTFMKWFQPKRPLRPVRRSQPEIVSANLSKHVTEIKIVVNVVQAFQVPVRRNVQELSLSPSRKPVSEIFSTVPVRPYVAVSFGAEQARTTTADGSNPTWNQDLVLTVPRRGCGDSSGWIHLQLFDEVLVDLLEDDRLRDSDIHQRRQLHWLAGLEIPLATVAQTGRIEGTFEMYSPPLMIGYDRASAKNPIDTGPNAKELPAEQRDSTYLSLFVTIVPAINGIEYFKNDKLHCNEVLYLEEHLRSWQEEYTELFPNRKFGCLVKDVTGKTCCVTRFVKALEATPFENDDIITTSNLCARFVSLIPFSDADPRDFSGVWLSSDQLLKLQIGSIVDHAVLLQCFLLGLDQECWLVLGYGIPHGSSAYVLIKQSFINEPIEYYVYDVPTGHKYNIKDTFCPLKRVFCLINQDNIWANLQKETRAHMTRYEVNRPSDWLPVFTKQISAPLGSLQPAALEFTDTTETNTLQERIEHRLRTKIMKWRRHVRTSWNRHACNAFRRLLPFLEQNVAAGNPDILDCMSASPHDITVEIQSLLNSHRVFGFPIHMPYTTLRAVTDAVRRTAIHGNDAPNLEFALAVHVHPYPCAIVAVWVYIATLARRR